MQDYKKCQEDFTDYEILFEELIDPFLLIVKNQKKVKQIKDFKELYNCLNEQEKLGEVDSWYYNIDQLIDINTSLNQFNFLYILIIYIMKLEEKHLIRFSIDIISIKNNRFYGKIYVQCKENKKLNKKQFRTQPVLDLMRISSSEQNFQNGFYTFEQQYSQEELFDILENENFQFDIFHEDRNKNQVNIAKVQVNLQPFKTLSFKKTKYSFVKLYDAFHTIKDIDPTSEGKKIGELRIKIYLEDLGTNKNGDFEENLLQQIQQDQVKNQDNYQNNEEFTLEELEIKIVWELETWKKSEEQKFLLLMKKKELEMINELQQKMSQKQKEQQKAFNNYEAKLFQIEQQLRAKSADLQRREFLIKNFENMMKEKIKLFAEEQLKQKKEMTNNNNRYENQIKELQKKLNIKQKQNSQLENKIQEKENQIQNLKEQINNSETSQLIQELGLKNSQIKNLEKDIEKYISLKKEYQIYIKDLQIEIDKFKQENEILKKLQTNSQVQHNQKNSIVFNDLKNELQQLQNNQSKDNTLDQDSELQNLIQQKEDFLLLGLDNDDIAIKEIDQVIKNIKDNKLSNQFIQQNFKYTKINQNRYLQYLSLYLHKFDLYQFFYQELYLILIVQFPNHQFHHMLMQVNTLIPYCILQDLHFQFSVHQQFLPYF